MALEAGKRLGPYEVGSPLGAGGMGEVYRARDTRLERTVAIKVLSAELSSSADIKLRFEREAKTISSLNHPNICSLFDIGCENGTDYLVMEYIEGETLSDVLKKGPMPLRQAIQVSLEVADALERAHRNGIIHRDLKPGNIMLTKGGAKLMDFGLAKPISVMSTAAKASGAAPIFSAALTQSSPVTPLTSVGSIVGTVQYMSPEQIEGREADARSDIFAFGLVMYEMVSGRRAFAGKTQASIVASILALDPPSVSAIQPALPSTLDTIINTCLAKDPEERFQSAHDLKLQLRLFQELGMAGSQAVAAAASFASGWKQRSLYAALAVLLLAASATGYAYWKKVNEPVRVVRGLLAPPEGGSIASGSPAQISPDGKYVVFGAYNKGTSQLWLQPFDSSAPQPMTGTDGASYPFWSADSRSVGFFSGGKLKRAEVAGGPAQTICDVSEGRGGTWNDEGIIVFGARVSGLMKVPAAGGIPVAASQLDSSKAQGTHRWPVFLPDGKHFLYMAGPTGNDNPRNELYLGSLDSLEVKPIFHLSSNVVYANGYLLYRRESSLMAHPFDPEKRVFTGDAVPMVEQLRFDPNVSAGSFSSSQNGMMVYQVGLSTSGAQQFLWFDSTGKELGPGSEKHMGYASRLSPDGTRAAVTVVDSTGNVDIWIYDLKRGVKSRLTFDPARDHDPIWFPDGKRVAYSSERDGGRPQIFAKNADGSGVELRLSRSDGYDFTEHISRDGKYLVYSHRAGQGSSTMDIYVLPLTGEAEAKPRAYIESPFFENAGRISHDSRWMVYASDESGKSEIYVSTFPQAGAKWQISNGGGREPVWSPSGNEIYYLTADNILMVVPLTITGSSIQPGISRKLFQTFPTAGRKPYDIARDGRIFVNSVGEDKSSAPISFIVNWPQAIRK